VEAPGLQPAAPEQLEVKISPGGGINTGMAALMAASRPPPGHHPATTRPPPGHHPAHGRGRVGRPCGAPTFHRVVTSHQTGLIAPVAAGILGSGHGSTPGKPTWPWFTAFLDKGWQVAKQSRPLLSRCPARLLLLSWVALGWD